MPGTKSPPNEPAASPAPEQPGRVFGLMGAPFTLGAHTLHYARYTTAGVRHLIDEFSKDGVLPSPIFSEGATTGEMIAEGLGLGGENACKQFERWLALITAEEQIPEGVAGQAMPEEIADCVDRFFEQSGFRLMADTIKNSAARLVAPLQAQAMQAARARLEQTPSEPPASEPPTTTESDSTS